MKSLFRKEMCILFRAYSDCNFCKLGDFLIVKNVPPIAQMDLDRSERPLSSCAIIAPNLLACRL